MKKKNMTIPIFVSHQGCPHDCVFCNQKRITGEISVFTEGKLNFDEYKLNKKIETYLSNENLGKSVEIAFFGGSFTGIERSLQIKYLETAQFYISKYNLKGIRISTRPDYINESIIDLLKNYSVKAVEIGVQSMDEDVLRASNRGHRSEDTTKAAKLIKDAGFELGLQMMTGLPQDTLDKCIETANKIIKLKPDTVRIYPALVLKDTILEKMYHEGSFVPLNLDTAISWVAEILTLFHSADIKISRVGLQASEEISFDNGIVAGPFHPAFRQLVEEKILHDEVIEFYSKNEGKELVIYANQKNYQSLIGHKKSFLKRILKEDMKIKFVLDNEKNFSFVLY
jgi:histone acetyltransferase (RNA polymerase elongator complex component)